MLSSWCTIIKKKTIDCYSKFWISRWIKCTAERYNNPIFYALLPLSVFYTIQPNHGIIVRMIATFWKILKYIWHACNWGNHGLVCLAGRPGTGPDSCSDRRNDSVSPPPPAGRAPPTRGDWQHDWQAAETRPASACQWFRLQVKLSCLDSGMQVTYNPV